MSSSPVIFAILLISTILIVGIALIVTLSRHHKAATGVLDLIGAVAFVETTLEPEGSVLVRGELWRAYTRRGVCVHRGHRVRVIGASGHLLEVEPAG